MRERRVVFGRVGRLACVVAAAALLVAACGEDGDDSPAAEKSSEKPVVTIGLIAPLESGLTSFGHDFQNAVDLAVDAANEADAIPGYTIKVRAMDDGSDPVKGEAAAKTLADDPSVIGVVGTYNSGVAATAAPVLDAAGIVMVSPGNTDSTLTLGADPAKPTRQWEHYFRMVAADNVQGPFLARQAAKVLKFERAAVISETKPVSKGLADVFADDFEKAGGQVVHREVVPDGSTSFATVLHTVAPLQPDVIFFGGEYEVAADLRTEATAAGVTAPLMGGDGIKDDAYIEAAKDDSNGDFASSIGQPVATSDSAADFLAAYDAADFKEPPGDFGPYAYDAANVIIAAAAKALEGTEAPQGDDLEVTDELRANILDAVQATDVQGASGHVWFDEYGDTKTKVLTLYKVVDKAWKTAITVEVEPSPDAESSSN